MHFRCFPADPWSLSKLWASLAGTGIKLVGVEWNDVPLPWQFKPLMYILNVSLNPWLLREIYINGILITWIIFKHQDLTLRLPAFSDILYAKYGHLKALNRNFTPSFLKVSNSWRTTYLYFSRTYLETRWEMNVFPPLHFFLYLYYELTDAKYFWAFIMTALHTTS